MLSGPIYKIALTVFSTLLTILIVGYAVMQFTTQWYQGSLQLVTQSAIYYARDDSARVKTKVFVIDRDKFEKTVENSDITDITKGSHLSFQYVHDTSSNATNLALTDPEIAVKAVRVIVTNGKNDHTDRIVTYTINTDAETKADDVTQPDGTN